MKSAFTYFSKGLWQLTYKQISYLLKKYHNSRNKFLVVNMRKYPKN